jgi:hypothetical protein
MTATFVSTDQPVLTLPPTLYAVAGREFNLYFENVLRCFQPIECYDVKIAIVAHTLPGGDYYDGSNLQYDPYGHPYRWSWTPEASQVDSYTLTMTVMQDGVTVATATSTLVITATQSAPTPTPYGITENHSVTDTNASSHIWATKYVAAASGTATAITFWNHGGANGIYTYGIYSDNSGSPGTLLSATEEGRGVDGGDAEVQANLHTPVTITQGTTYWLAVNSSLGLSGAVSGTSNITVKVTSTYSAGTLPSSFPGGGTDPSENYDIHLLLASRVVPTRRVLMIGDSTGPSPLSELVNLGNSDYIANILTVGTQTTNSVLDFAGTSRTVNYECVGGESAVWFYTNASSPFVFSGVFDFAAYLAAHPTITLSSTDWVIIALGINDLQNPATGDTYQTDAAMIAAAATSVSDILAMVANIRTAAGCRVGIGTVIPPAHSQEGFAWRSAPPSRNRYARNRFLLTEAILKAVGNATWSGDNPIPKVIPISHGLDTRNSFSLTLRSPHAYIKPLVDFIITGITTAPTAGAVYTDASSNSYTVTSVSLSGGTGTVDGIVRMQIVNGATLSETPGLVPSTFTLTKSSGTGDATLTALSWTPVPGMCEIIQNNHVHPAYAGYFQIAGQVYAALVGLEGVS